MRLGEFLFLFRRQKGLSQIDLARLTGTHQSVISRLETNRWQINVKQATVLARYFQCSPADILFHHSSSAQKTFETLLFSKKKTYDASH